MRKQIYVAAILAGCAATGTAAVAADGATTVGGQSFIDFSHITQDSNGVNQAQTGTGMDVKRFYIMVDHKFDDIWSANVTTDAQWTSTSGGVTEFFVKKLYLQAKIDDAFVVHAGAFTSPWAPYVETLYGYRFIEKTVTDRLGFAYTADWGLNASGKVANGMLNYSASITNGGGFKNPTRTKDVDYEARIGVVPVAGLTLAAGFYSGHLGQVTQLTVGPTQNATRWNLAAGYVTSKFRVGAEYFEAKDYTTVNTLAAAKLGTSLVQGYASLPYSSDKATGASGWASFNFTDQFSIFGRYDQTKPSKDVAPNLKDTYFNVGVAFKPSKPLDLALVYKDEKVENGSMSISNANANGSADVIGGATATTQGTYKEIGVYAEFNF